MNGGKRCLSWKRVTNGHICLKPRLYLKDTNKLDGNFLLFRRALATEDDGCAEYDAPANECD